MSQYDEKNAKQASELGFSANNKAGGDFNLSGGQANYGDYGSVLDGENRAKEDLIKARRLMEQSELSMDDLIGLGLTDTDQTTKQEARLLYQMNQQRSNTGRAPQAASPRAPLMENSGSWEVVENVATLNNGKRIKVWTVEDAITQFNTGKNYRFRSVAEKVAAVVNATNNVDDSRIRMIDEAHDKYVNLKKQVSQAKKMINEGRGDRKKLSRLQGELGRIGARLGIA